MNASVFSPTFGLSPDQLAQLSNAERKRLISIRNPDGTFTAFDPKNPFAGFQGDHLDFLRDPGRAFEDSEARASVVNLFELVRPVPNCPIDDYELPTLDLDDNTPFPRLDPALFPSPAPEVPLPATPKELADVRMHPDLALTIAKLRDPWLCLPKDGRGRPNKRSIKADGTLRNAFEKVRRALMDAKSLTRTIWRERWDRYEFARLIAEGRFTSPINPTPTPPNSS